MIKSRPNIIRSNNNHTRIWILNTKLLRDTKMQALNKWMPSNMKRPSKKFTGTQHGKYLTKLMNIMMLKNIQTCIVSRPTMLLRFVSRKFLISLKSQIKRINMMAKFLIFNALIDTSLEQLASMTEGKMSKMQFTK